MSSPKIPLLTFILALPAICASPAMPDHKLTPGDVDPLVMQDNIQKTICVTGYTKGVRNVPKSVKIAVFREYGIDHKLAGRYEVDHLISLENGGSNAIRNLWPQPYNPKPGARQKDVLETYLKREVCAGRLTLAEDQKILAGNWYAGYLRFGLK
jgi:hypothetical protein